MEIAQSLSSQGCHVVLVDTNRDVHAAATRIPVADAFLLDITDEAAIESVIREVESRCGSVELLTSDEAAFITEATIYVNDSVFMN